MMGTEIKDTTKNHVWMVSWEVEPYYPHIGIPPQQLSYINQKSTVLPNLRGMLIMVVMIDGATAL